MNLFYISKHVLASRGALCYNDEVIKYCTQAVLQTLLGVSQSFQGGSTMEHCAIPNGFCQCGCGSKTEIAKQTRANRGWIKGQPKFYIIGHTSRTRNISSGFITCTKCKNTLPLEKFKSKLISGKPQYDSWCKDCNYQLHHKWHAEHREEEYEKLVAWRKKNPDKVKAQLQLRYGRRRGASGHSTSEQVMARIAYYGGRCAYCGGPYEHLDHVIPISRGGTNWPANLRPACEKCNTRKNNLTLSEWQGKI